ncbi:hypothetical protein HY797_03135 [Candidatus Falkowbacteria bacterium]|nr:hypothetical protein [Candidatus Falkowbacteria bacterium]
MKKQDRNKPLAKADLDNLYNRLDKSVDIKFGRFAEEVILPAVENIVDQKLDSKFGKFSHEIDQKLDSKLGKFNHEMKSYIDSKLAETKGDIISFMKGDQERDKNWKYKIISILKREKLAKPEEVKILANLIR